MPAPERLHLSLAWEAGAPTAGGAPPGVVVRALAPSDARALGRLMWRAFRGTVEESASREEAERDAAGTLAGCWGPLFWEASLAAERRGEVIAVTVCVRERKHSVALLAFALTEPAEQGQGVGRALIQESIARLDALGIHELHLAVVHDNPARRLYQRLGFVAPSSTPVTPAEHDRNPRDPG